MIELTRQKSPKELYIDLMMKTLSFSLWPEPPLPVQPVEGTSRFKRLAFATANRFLKSQNMLLARNPTFTQDQRDEGMVWPGYADTMVGLKRLENLRDCVESVIRNNIEGDFIETGVWRGGSCIFMRAILAANGIGDRIVYVADSFMGLPKPNEKLFPADEGDKLHLATDLAVSREEVEKNFARYGLLDDQVVFVEGWFSDTLPKLPVAKLSILRLDGDMYESTFDALENLYPKLSVGGFCIIDDYHIPSCAKAIEDYRSSNNISSELKTIDWCGKYWEKE